MEMHVYMHLGDQRVMQIAKHELMFAKAWVISLSALLTALFHVLPLNTVYVMNSMVLFTVTLNLHMNIIMFFLLPTSVQLV